MLAGMGVPDLRGGLGTSTFFSTADDLVARESEQVERLEPNADGSFTARLPGPRNPKDRALLRVDLTIRTDGDAVTIHSAGVPAVLRVRSECWSDWLRVKFKIGLLQSVAGLVRFRLVRPAPGLELYASPVNFDPEVPPVSAQCAGGLRARTRRRGGHVLYNGHD